MQQGVIYAAATETARVVQLPRNRPQNRAPIPMDPFPGSFTEAKMCF